MNDNQNSTSTEDLFSWAQKRKIWTVSEITASIKSVLEQQFGVIWVCGELTNLKAYPSGHIYFSLKDEFAQISCVMFKTFVGKSKQWLADGLKVVALSELSVYEARGQYQLIVRELEPVGKGALQIAFEKLKAKLQAEGLFDKARKRKIPEFPKRIGIVTSTSGAAIRDIVHIIGRRNPALELIIAPCRVQGEGAAEEIAAAIKMLNQWSTQKSKELNDQNKNWLDLIIVTRGGGSLEDLWAFNEEIVARAIFESSLPVISAVGHEIDFTISDFVADLRAATPSAAAELVTETAVLAKNRLARFPELLTNSLSKALKAMNIQFSHLQHRLNQAHPKRKIEDLTIRVDDLNVTLLRIINQRYSLIKNSYTTLLDRFFRFKPENVIRQKFEKLLLFEKGLVEKTSTNLKLKELKFSRLENQLKLLSPLNILKRGYSITMDARTGKIIKSVTEVGPGQNLKTRLSDGEINVKAF